MPIAAIGIGANLGDARATVQRAMTELTRVGRIVRASSLYRTAPWGVADQPDFINAAVLLDTTFEPRDLLRALKALEEELGRTPSARWGPRALDLDILTYGDLRIDEPDLTIPHRHLHERAFVLVPLAEIEPAYAPALQALPPQSASEVVRL